MGLAGLALVRSRRRDPEQEEKKKLRAKMKYIVRNMLPSDVSIVALKRARDRARRVPPLTRARRGIAPQLLALATIAVLAFAFALLFGVLNTIQQQTNSTITLDPTFKSAIDTSKNFTALGLTIALAIIVVSLVMYMVRVIGGGGGGA